MRCRLILSVFCLLAGLANIIVPAAQAQAEDTRITAPVVQQDRSADIAAIVESAHQRAAELADLEAAKKAGASDTMINTHILDFRADHAAVLAIADNPDGWLAWQRAATIWLEAGDADAVMAAASHLYGKARGDMERANALDLFVRALLLQTRNAEALALLEDTAARYKTPQRAEWLAELKDRFSLRITDLALDTSGHAPSACFVFSAPLATELARRAGDYVRISSRKDIAVKAREDRLCLTGLRFGETLDVTLLAGLPDRAGGSLGADVHRQITLPDREPGLSFGNGTYILPKVGDETVPLKSVNADKAYLTLFRIPDRGLVDWMKSGNFGRDISGWARNMLENDQGERVWTGTVDIASQRNSDTTTLIPVRDLGPALKPGLYGLTATLKTEDETPRWEDRQTQWLLVSDLGLMTLAGADGLHVFVNSLATARPMDNVVLRLVARNNAILSEIQTDRQGRATIPPALLRGQGGNQPMVLVAATVAGDYAFLPLTGPALDLSDRGAEGRLAPGLLDAFAYTDRGIYRPGDTVHLSALLRDGQAKAVPRLPLSIVITRPDGVIAQEQTLTGDALGAYALDYALSPMARAGQWRVALHADDAEQTIGEVRFQVGDFVPQRLAVGLEAVGDTLTPGTPLETRVQADFLYGAPGAGLSGNLSVMLEPDPTPFADFKAFTFGLENDPFTREQAAATPFETGVDGQARIAVSVDRLPETSRPLRALIKAEVADVGGRSVADSVRVPVARPAVMIGVRADAGGSFADDAPTTFRAVALDGHGSPLAGQPLTAVWIREHHYFNWYLAGDRWQHHTTVEDEILAEEDATTGPDGLITLSRAVTPGRYRLEVMDSDSTAIASTRFTSGWWNTSASPDVPDALELTLDSAAKASGDTLRGFVKAPFAGRALLTVVNDRVLAHKVIDLAEDGTAFDFTVKSDWGPSAYVLATALRPGAGEISRLPVRATGLAWFSVDRTARTGQITFDLPASALPGQPVTLPLRWTGGPVPENVRVSIAAVDQGVLNITGFNTPDPAEYYFGKRGFGHDLRDIYGRLIRTEAGQRGTVRTGGDMMMMRAAAGSNLASPILPTTKAVALIQRDIPLDANGAGSVTFDLPDFLGQLRLMAVAYSASAVGTGEGRLTVRTPVTADLITPRFLAPGDQSHATLSVQNLSGGEATLNLSVAAQSPAVRIGDAPASITLKDGERRDITLPMEGVAVGNTGLDISVTGDGLPPVDRQYNLSVRAAWPFVTERAVTPLAPGARAPAGAPVSTTFLPGTVAQSLIVSARPDLATDRFLTDLNTYSYRCSEQTVSRAFPALMHAELDRLYDLSVDADTATDTVNDAIVILLDRQRSDGGFGLWHPFGTPNPWLDAYVTDFLMRAREKGYTVPDRTVDRALSHLKGIVDNRRDDQMEAMAYAHYVLARYGKVEAGEVRYFADRFSPRLRTPLAMAQTAVALNIVGETAQAQSLRDGVLTLTGSRAAYYGDYGSALRNRAGVATLVGETWPDAGLLAGLADDLENAVTDDRWYSTQEMAWLTRAAAVYGGSSTGPLTVDVGGQAVTAENGFWKQVPDPDADLSRQTVTNTADVPVRLIHTVRGVLTSPPPAAANGFTLKRTYYDLSGKIIDPTALPRNGRFVVVLSGRVAEDAIADPLVVDLLAAGLEIESTDTAGLDFVGDLTSTLFTEGRDDRFVAALDLPEARYNRARTFRVAYIVRAITPGDYAFPGAFVEDMYKPRFNTRGATGRITVTD